jgi:hypothetical protein
MGSGFEGQVKKCSSSTCAAGPQRIRPQRILQHRKWQNTAAKLHCSWLCVSPFGCMQLLSP